MVGPASLVDSLRELLVDDPVLDSAALVGKLLELHPDLRTSVSEAALTTLVESELSFQAMCRSNAIGQRDLAEARRQAGLAAAQGDAAQDLGEARRLARLRGLVTAGAKAALVESRRAIRGSRRLGDASRKPGRPQRMPSSKSGRRARAPRRSPPRRRAVWPGLPHWRSSAGALLLRRRPSSRPSDPQRRLH